MAEVPTVSTACGVAEQMPTQRQLKANGYSSLAVAINKYCGGFRKFAARLNQTRDH